MLQIFTDQKSWNSMFWVSTIFSARSSRKLSQFVWSKVEVLENLQLSEVKGLEELKKINFSKFYNFFLVESCDAPENPEKINFSNFFDFLCSNISSMVEERENPEKINLFWLKVMIFLWKSMFQISTIFSGRTSW